MRNVKLFFGIGAFSLLVLVGLPAAASAQWRDRDRNDDYYGNGRYGRDIRGTVESLQNRSRNFERQVSRMDDRRDDRWGNRDRYDRVDNLDELARRFKNAAENLRDEYGRGRNLNNSRDEAQRVLDIGSQIDRIMSRSRNGRNNNVRYIANEWSAISNDLRTVASAYGLAYNRGGNWRNRMPFPLPF